MAARRRHFSTPSTASSSDDDDSDYAYPKEIKRPKSLGNLLYQYAQNTDSTTDLTILVGPNSVPVPGHKSVFIVMSEVFATQLDKQCWNEGISRQDEKMVIRFPEDVGEDSSRAFIKYLYTEEFEPSFVNTRHLSPSEQEHLILEVMALADLYLVKGLLELCDQKLSIRLGQDNCVLIYEHAKRYSAVTSIAHRAYKFFKRNIFILVNDILGPRRKKFDWTADTWRALLQEDYLIFVTEISLFRALLVWKDQDPESRFEDFKELAKFIRYPLMTQSEFSQYVTPSKALDPEDVIDIFVMFSSRESANCSKDVMTRLERFNSTPRRRKIASSSRKLMKYLSSASPEDIIILKEMTYEGIFNMESNDVTILGAGIGKTTLRSPKTSHPKPILCIFGTNCNVENLSILTSKIKNGRTTIVMQGSSNSLKNVEIGVHPIEIEHSAISGDDTFESIDSVSVISIDSDDEYFIPMAPRSDEVGDSSGTSSYDAENHCYYGCLIEGNRNIISNISVSGHSKGIYLNGCDNQFTNAEITDCEVGICVLQYRNRLESVTINNVKTGINLQGHESQLRGIKFVYPLIPDNEVEGAICAVNMMGCGHKIEDVKCQGLEDRNTRWSVDMTLCTSSCSITSCGPGQVTVRGLRNRLVDVKSANCLNVFGAEHTFDLCEANTLVLGPGLRKNCFRFSECRFQSEF